MKCILICLLIFCCGFASKVLTLKCASSDGLSVEDVRKVVRKCIKKDSQSNSDIKNYDEYGTFESDYEISSQRDKEGNFRRNYNDRTYGNNYNSRINQHYDQQPGGHYNFPMPNDRRDSNRYQSTYNVNNNVNNRNNLYNSRNHNNSNDSSLKHEKDWACILQCFFQELKMTNSEGFPDKHKALHVMTRELRDQELKDFYTDSIQQCFYIIDTDSKQHRDNCLYSKTLITCLAERAKANCADWDGERVIF